MVVTSLLELLVRYSSMLKSRMNYLVVLQQKLYR